VKGKNVYSRRVSSEEAREGYLLVLKNKLRFFPPLGTGFDIVQDDVIGEAKVESYRCTCRGPDLPHEHYFIRRMGLKARDRVEIREDPERQGRYVLKILH
jgi:hypothetical protein